MHCKNNQILNGVRVLYDFGKYKNAYQISTIIDNTCLHAQVSCSCSINCLDAAYSKLTLHEIFTLACFNVPAKTTVLDVR